MASCAYPPPPLYPPQTHLEVTGYSNPQPLLSHTSGVRTVCSRRTFPANRFSNRWHSTSAITSATTL